MKQIDYYLQDALSPNEEMSGELKTRIMTEIETEKEHNMNRKTNKGYWRWNLPAAAAIAVVVVMATSVTAFAAWKCLSAKEVAEKMEDRKLAAVFSDESTWVNAETQNCGDYEVALLGLASGMDLSDRFSIVDGEVVKDNTYAVVAIRHTDGSPMPDTSSAEYGDEEFLVSPYIQGLDPATYNIFSLCAGGYSAIVENGVQYRLMEVENIEAFADREVYLGVSDGSFYNSDAYCFDESTGKITRNPAYHGVNALFALSMDAAKANAETAKEIIDRINQPSEEEGDWSEYNSPEVEAFMTKLTPENIDEYAEPIESTRSVITPAKDGSYSYSFETPSGTSGSGETSVMDVFPDGKPGMYISGYVSGDTLNDLLIETHTLNSDGTVTFVVYAPKK